jgi:hypothetical protein
MGVAFPLLSFVGLTWLWNTHAKVGWRTAVLSSAVVHGVFTCLLTEILSPFFLLARTPLVVAWGVVTALVLVALGFSYKKWPPTLPRTRPHEGEFLLGGVAMIVLVVGIIAVISPPNNGDGMTYHMSRVMHWIQNRSVAFYPTSILRQLHLAPGAGYTLLHLQLLAGGDRFANLAQWGAMVGALVGVSLLAREIGAGQMGQLAAVVFAATLPMGILQASSVQNDYVVSLWLVAFVYFLCRHLKQPSWLHAWLMASALGLAIFTKATAYIFAAPFLLWWIVRMQRWSIAVGFITCVITVGVLNVSFLLRNERLYGNPLGPGYEEVAGGRLRYANEKFGPRVLASNVIRNISLHIGTPIKGINHTLEAAIVRFHRLVGMDVDDPATTWDRFELNSLSNSEDNAGNPLHFLLLGAFTLWLFVPHTVTEMEWARRYAVCCVGGFLLFCLYLKWQPYHSRLHLPWFILSAPYIGFLIARLPSKGATGLQVVLLVAALPWVLCNVAKPLLAMPGLPLLNNGETILKSSRMSLYLSARRDLEPAFREAAAVLHQLGCKQVGLETESLEYPFWIYLKDAGIERIEHVDVKNRSAALRYRPGFRPDAVLVFSGAGNRKEVPAGFSERWSAGAVQIFLSSDFAVSR